MEENARKQIEQNEREMDSLKKSYEQKLSEALAKVMILVMSFTIGNAEKCMIFKHFFVV